MQFVILTIEMLAERNFWQSDTEMMI